MKSQNQNTGDEQIDQVIAVGSRRGENRESRNQGEAEIKGNERFPMIGFYPRHQIYRQTQATRDWDCPSPSVAPFPQFVPTCYRPQVIRFNPSGTRLYIQDNIDDLQGQRWDAALRINIDMG